MFDAVITYFLWILEILQKVLNQFGQGVVFFLWKTGHAAVAIIIKYILRILLFYTFLALSLRGLEFNFMGDMLTNARNVVGRLLQKVACFAVLNHSGFDDLQDVIG